MKKAIAFLACILMLLLCGCDKGGVSPVNSTESCGTVTVINRVTDSDVWILSDTETNRKTTLWGTATVAALKTDASGTASLPAPGDEGLYLLRMIDVDETYYSAGAIELKDGWTMEVRKGDNGTITVKVTDADGNVQCVYDVFSAHL